VEKAWKPPAPAVFPSLIQGLRQAPFGRPRGETFAGLRRNRHLLAMLRGDQKGVMLHRKQISDATVGKEQIHE
jgi:hypothetical protein